MLFICFYHTECSSAQEAVLNNPWNPPKNQFPGTETISVKMSSPYESDAICDFFFVFNVSQSFSYRKSLSSHLFVWSSYCLSLIEWSLVQYALYRSQTFIPTLAFFLFNFMNDYGVTKVYHSQQFGTYISSLVHRYRQCNRSL